MSTFNLVCFFHLKKLILKTEKKRRKMANKVYTLFDTEIENDNLFEIDLEENENKNEKLPSNFSKN